MSLTFVSCQKSFETSPNEGICESYTIKHEKDDKSYVLVLTYDSVSLNTAYLNITNNSFFIVTDIIKLTTRFVFIMMNLIYCKLFT